MVKQLSQRWMVESEGGLDEGGSGDGAGWRVEDHWDTNVNTWVSLYVVGS